MREQQQPQEDQVKNKKTAGKWLLRRENTEGLEVRLDKCYVGERLVRQRQAAAGNKLVGALAWVGSHLMVGKLELPIY